MQDKNDPGKENRTFETRLEFIADIFANPRSKEEIMTSCVQFKLNKTYEQYLIEVKRSLEFLAKQKVDQVVKKL